MWAEAAEKWDRESHLGGPGGSGAHEGSPHGPCCLLGARPAPSAPARHPSWGPPRPSLAPCSPSKWPDEHQLPMLWENNRDALLAFPLAAAYGG